MKQLIKRNIRFSLKTNIMLIFAIGIIFSMAPIAFYSLSTMNHQIHENIIEHSRGSYDLLVRSPDAITEIEKELNLVPENYIGGGKGGISLEDWQTIKERDDIEIAAPVASIGYFTGLNTTLGVLPSPENSAIYEVQYATSDGVQDYFLEPYHLAFLKFEEDEGYPLESIIHQQELLSFMHPVHALFSLPAIEFGEEHVGVIRQNVEGHEKFSNAYAVPVLQLQDSSIAVKAQVKGGELPYTKEELLDLLKQFDLNPDEGLVDFENPNHQTFMNELMQSTHTNEFSYTVDLSPFMHPFNAEGKGIVIQENGELVDMDEYSNATSYASSISWDRMTRYFLIQQLKYEQTANGLVVKKISEENGMPIYREIEEKGVSVKDAKPGELELIIDPVGYYEIGGKSQSIAASPLGIYQLEPVYQLNSAGEKTMITPTFSAGSFVTAPAEGLTNMESAEFIKGDLPIDAIRIKVADITNYSPEAAKKIQTVAEGLQQMGLHVDIVAGSSLSTMEIEVEGLGVVQESWTTIGASGAIVEQWDITNLLLALAFTIVALTYVMNRVKLWSLEKVQSTQYLKLLGWTYKDIQKLYKKEMMQLIVVASVISLVGVAIWMYKDVNYVTLLMIQLLVIFVLALGIYLLVTRSLNHILYQKGKNVKRKISGSPSLVVRNIFYYQKEIFVTFIQILFVSTLATFVYLSLTESITQTNQTILGQYINTEVNHWNQLLIISTYLLAVITLIESLSRLFQDRAMEMINFRRIGWKIKDIKALFMKEIAIWIGVSLAIGSVLSLLLFFGFYSFDMKSILLIGITNIVMYVFLLLIAAIILSFSHSKLMIKK